MSQLYYDVPIEEVLLDDAHNDVQHIRTDLPHFKQIKAWLPGEWEKCEIHKWFDGILKNKVESTKMRVFQTSDKRTIARIKITFIPGFRVTEKYRQACWEYMDSQMSDGFGESYHRHCIPDVDSHYRLLF